MKKRSEILLINIIIIFGFAIFSQAQEKSFTITTEQYIAKYNQAMKTLQEKMTLIKKDEMVKILLVVEAKIKNKNISCLLAAEKKTKLHSFCFG
jgi:hypothetical protein